MLYLSKPFNNNFSRLFGLDTFFNDMLEYNNIEHTTDIKETDNNIIFKTVLPGFNKDDIKMSVEDSVLTINAKYSDKTDKNNWLKEEYNKSYSLPQKVDIDKISAVLENGILTITLPFNEKAKPKQISIN